MKKIIIISFIFFLDRITKIYLLNLQENGTDIDFYINSFLNFYLVWNSGIGFGLVSLEADIYYHILTVIIALVNVVLMCYGKVPLSTCNSDADTTRFRLSLVFLMLIRQGSADIWPMPLVQPLRSHSDSFVALGLPGL